MSTEQKDSPKVLMLPPTMLVLFITGGIVLDWLIPMGWGHGWGWLGLILVAVSIFLTGWAKKTFQKIGTNVPPNQPALAIAINGPYKYTRNPMYLSMLILYAGLAMLADAPLMLLLLLPLFYLLDQKVIVPEEIYLTEKFSDTYTVYTKKVRRWI